MRIILTVMFIGICSVGCKQDLTPIESAGKEIEKATKNLENGMARLAEVDPAGMNKLLKQNEELRERLLVITGKLSAAGVGTGVFEMKDKRLFLQVENLRGAFRVDSWIDNKDHWVINARELANRDLSLKAFGLTETALNQATAEASAKLQENVYWSALHRAGQLGCTEVAENAFKKFLTTGSMIGNGPITKIALNDQFLLPGDRNIIVQITPEEKLSPGWSFVGKIVAYAPDNSYDVVKEFEWSDRGFPNHIPGAPLPEKVARVRIAVTLPPK